MKPFLLLIDEQKLQALDTLVSAAGSRLGDTHLMTLSVDVRRWLKSAMDEAAQQAAARVAKTNGESKADATMIEAEAVQ